MELDASTEYTMQNAPHPSQQNGLALYAAKISPPTQPSEHLLNLWGLPFDLGKPLHRPRRLQTQKLETKLKIPHPEP